MGSSLAAEPLLALAVTVTSEQRVDSVLQSIVQGLASQPGVALARIWLLPSVGLSSFCLAVSDLPNHLCLVASAGTPINSPGEDWCFLQGHFARVPFNVGKVGQVAASRHPILVEDVTVQNEWIVRPEWAEREEIRSFAGHPLIFRDKLLGVIAVFSRQPLGQQEFTWLGLFANQAAVAISNACAEQALQSNERNVAAIIDTIPALAWCNLPDGSNEFLNKGWHEYTGLSPEESHGWGWQVAFHPEDLPPLIDKWRKMLISGESDEIEARLRRRDGVYRWFLIRAQALRDDSGKIVRWYGTSTDIEDRKLAEEGWRASERNLAAIINTIPTAAWTTRPDGYCDFLNLVWLNYAGMTAEQAQGWGWSQAIYTDDRKKLVEEWQSCLASGTPIDTEARIRRSDGSYRWFLIRGNPLRDEAGNILKWYGTCIDIEDRKRGEETLRARELSWRQIVDNIPGLVATTGPLGQIEFLNRQILEYFGKTAEELKSWALTDAVHPDDLARVVEARKKSIESGQIYEDEHRCRRADGVYRWFHACGLPVRDPENKITAWYLLLTDIDDRKKAEEALRARELDARSLLDNMPGFLGRHAPDGTPEIVNRPFLDYYSKTLEDVQKWMTSDLVHPDDLAHAMETFGEGIASGQPWETELRLRRFDGTYRWFQARWVPERDVEGKILHWNALTTDIDDRKKAEEALNASERNLRVMVNVIPTFIGMLRTDGSLLYANQTALDYTGVTLENMQQGDYRVRFFHREDLERLQEERREALTNAVPFENEQRLLGKDGKYRWFVIRYNPVLDEQGRIDRWYAAAFDIEDRKQAEQALRLSERNFRQVIDTIPTHIHVMRPDGSILYVSPAALDYTGLTQEESQKEDYRTRIFHPEDMTERVRHERLEAFSRPVPFEVEHRVLGKNGLYRWFLTRCNPLLDDKGRIDRWYAATTDIDDRKRAEAQVEQAYLRLAEAQRLSKTGSFITDLLADEHDWSEEAFRIFEFDPSTKVTVQMIRDIVHPDDLPTFDAVIARGMTGTDVDFLFRIVTARGDVKYLRGMARVMVQDADRLLFIGAFQDITQSKLAEEALDKARSELAQVARITTLNALTASIAHEINQPLASLVTNASISLRRLNVDPPNVDGARETVQRTIRDANRASDVITRLRALFTKREFTLEPLDLNEAARDVITVLSDQLQRKRVLLLTDFDTSLPAITGDRVQLQQVILNLLRNASDAMSSIDDRPRELVIRTAREDGDSVCLSVKDAGVGLEAQAAERLFQPFYTTKAGGMGIGLSISRSIIEAHQGRLWAAPNSGPGTTFAFSIPRAQAHHAKSSFAIGFLSNGDELRWMPEVLKILQDEFPNLDVTTSSQYSPFLAEALSKGEIDAALLRKEEGWPDLVYEMLLRSPLVVCLPARHRLAAFQAVSPQDLVGETFITVAKTAPVLRQVIDDYLKQSGVNISANHEIDHPAKAVALIASAGGVGIWPAYPLLNFLPDSIVTRPLKGDSPTIDLVLGYKKSNQSPILKFLLSRLDELIARATKRATPELSNPTQAR